MKILLVTTDQSYFSEGPRLEELKKMTQYMEQIHVFVVTKEDDPYKLESFDGKIFIYPTKTGLGLWSVRKIASMATEQLTLDGQFIIDLIVADDPYHSSGAAYLLSRKYKKSFLINVGEDLSNALMEEDLLSGFVKKKISEYVLPRAHGVRVYDQSIGETLSTDFPILEDKIYVLPEPVELNVKGVEETGSEDVKKNYPQFNLHLVTIVESKDKQLENRLLSIGQAVQLKYRRAGIIAIDNKSYYKHINTPFLVWEKGIRDLSSYYKGASIIIDVSNESRPGGALTQAALLGCPIVAAASPGANYIIRSGKNGFIANPDDLSDFVGRISEIVETPGLREMIKLFRHEMDERMAHSTEEYYPTLASIWKRAWETRASLEGSKVEEYATDLVYSLKGTRNLVSQVAEKISTDMSSVEKRLKDPLHATERKMSLVSVRDDDHGVFDVDSVMKNERGLPKT